MKNYFTESFKRKIARRITKEYPTHISKFDLQKDGLIEFANWDNPLVMKVEITQPIVDFYRKFIAPGDLVIDIGANIGDTTVPMGIAAGKDGLAIGIDPNPYVFKILEKNATLNINKLNIAAKNVAVSTQEEEYYYIASEASFSNGGISLTKDSRHGKYVFPEKIKGVRLIDLLENEFSQYLPKLSFIKIDTEGYDKEIIKSIADLMVKYKPVIIAESFGKNTDEEKMELYDVIAQHDYDVYSFDDFDTNAKIQLLQSKEEMTNWKSNIDICGVPKNSGRTINM